jgi:hypothetical protein
VHLSLEFRSAQSGTERPEGDIFRVRRPFKNTTQGSEGGLKKKINKKRNIFRESKKKELFVKSSEFCLIRKTARARSCV